MVYLNKGVIGTGRIARTFCEALKGCSDAELYASTQAFMAMMDERRAQWGMKFPEE